MNEPKIKILEKKLLSDDWYLLHKFTYSYQKPQQAPQVHTRESYHRGNGVAILLYDSTRQKIILTHQFRLPTYVNGNEKGMLIEVCAGVLDIDSPEECIRREVEEETGYQIAHIEKVFEAYMSPGSVTEMMHLFIAQYTPDMKKSQGGGLTHEEEDIEVLELDFEKALEMLKTGEIRDAKTIMLLQYAQIHSLMI